jgi:hypothetical protein
VNLTIDSIGECDYIDPFCKRTRRHSHLGGVSPEQFEAAQKSLTQGVH